jgi:hypothetical protein
VSNLIDLLKEENSFVGSNYFERKEEIMKK